MAKKKAGKSYANALVLAKAFEENFLELAVTLEDLQQNEPDRFRDFIKASGIGRRKAYYLVKLAKTFKEFPVPEAILKELGWTKLVTICGAVTADNLSELIEFARTHTVKEISAYLKGDNPEDNAHSVLLYFNDENYQALVDKLVEFGAEKRGRNLVGKEEALMRLLEAVSK